MTLSISPEILTWLALTSIAGFVLWLIAVFAVLLWIHRRPSGANVLPLRRRPGARERAEAANPIYDPRRFRRPQ